MVSEMIRSSNSVKDFVDEHTTTLSPLWRRVCTCLIADATSSFAEQSSGLSHVVMIAFLLLGLMYLFLIQWGLQFSAVLEVV
jgi:hypothetical protein